MQGADEHWQRLGELLIAARVAKGFTKRAEWQRHLGLSHGRTLFDIENAKRRNFDPSTIAFIEHAYGWRPGSIRAVLAGGEPTVTEQNSEPQPEVDRLPVGRAREGGEVLRPDDFTPEQWRDLRRYAEFIRSQNPDAQ